MAKGTKLKTHRGAAKRFRVTGSGRVKCRRAFRNHILTKKAQKAKRQRRTMLTVAECHAKAVNQMMPN